MNSSKNIIINSQEPEAYSKNVPGTIWLNPFTGMFSIVDENGVKSLMPFSNIHIPKIYVKPSTDRQGQLFVNYKNELNRIWHFLNPQIFLLRHKQKRRNKLKRDYGVNNVDRNRMRSGVVHPVDFTASETGKWEGWRWFNGKQFSFEGNPIQKRNTEFSVYGTPGTIQPITRNGQTLSIPDSNNPNNWWHPNQSLVLNFNAYQYTKNQKLNFDTASELDYYSWNSDHECRVSGERVSGYQSRRDKEPGPNGDFKMRRKQHTIKFQLVIVVDNLLATKTNGMCPVIFGEPSEIFISRNYNKNNPYEAIGQRYFKTY